MAAPALRLGEAHTYYCVGDWLAHAIPADFTDIFLLAQLQSEPAVTLDLSQMTQCDTAGAYLLFQLKTQLAAAGIALSFTQLDAHHQALFTLIDSHHDAIAQADIPPKQGDAFTDLGSFIMRCHAGLYCFFVFMGQCYEALRAIIRKPRRFKTIDFIHHLYQTGCLALGIIGLLSFLIGIVLAYEMALQLRTYGANIYIVKITGISMVREFAPLMVAVILAGRTSSAFTAELGMMRFNAEIDALEVMGLSPMQHLIIPRLMAVFMIMPLLIFWADIFGVMGSMLMAKNMLQVNYVTYIARFHQEVDFNSYLIGFIKAPVFAGIVSAVGCFQGMRTEPSAQSIGTQTTKSVVQAIFFIIVADALFSVIFSVAGI